MTNLRAFDFIAAVKVRRSVEHNEAGLPILHEPVDALPQVGGLHIPFWIRLLEDGVLVSQRQDTQVCKIGNLAAMSPAYVIDSSMEFLSLVFSAKIKYTT